MDTSFNMLKPSFRVILGELNARSRSWWSDDITSYEGSHGDSNNYIWILSNNIRSHPFTG